MIGVASARSDEVNRRERSSSGGGPVWLRLIGPAFAVSIGYIDPGNWATDLAASAFGCRLLWVVIVASVIAIILQLGAAQLALTAGDDLASLIARRWPRAALPLGALYELAIIATDVAEFAGIVVGLRLLFSMSIALATLLALVAVGVIFAFNRGRLHRLELFLLAILAAVTVGVLWEVTRFHPGFGVVLAGALTPQMPDRAAILIAMGIVGATVMPHNLFLHSALVSDKCRGESAIVRARRGQFFATETLVALALAALANAAILIFAAGAKPGGSSFAALYAAIDLHAGAVAAIVFGGGLTISGLASSVSATLSNDYVAPAFSPFRVSPMVRRLIAALPAGAMLIAGVDPIAMMLWSQAALAAILPAALAPLLIEIASRRVGIVPFSRKWVATIVIAASICVAFDGAFIAAVLRP